MMRTAFFVLSLALAAGVSAQDEQLTIVERNAVVSEYAKCAAYYDHIGEKDQAPILSGRAVALLDHRNSGQSARYERIWNSQVGAATKRITWLIQSDPTDIDYLHGEFAERCASIVENNSYQEILSKKAGMVARKSSNASQKPARSREPADRSDVGRGQNTAGASDGQRSTPAPIAATVVADDPYGLAGEWRGYYQCDGGWEIFMRLGIAPDGARYNVRFDFSSGLRGMYPKGAVSMSATYSPGSREVVFSPDAWIHQARGVDLIGFAGHLAEGGEVISGNVTDSQACSTFSVSKRVVEAHSVNGNGLLFHYRGRGDITATAEHCAAYAGWLASGEEVAFGGSNIFTGMRDQDAMRRVLGKDLDQWGENDNHTLRELARHCRSLLESSQNAELRELAARANSVSIAWAPQLLLRPKFDRDGELSDGWVKAEQAIMANDSQRVQVGDVLAEIEALPPVVSSVLHIDELLSNVRSTSHRKNRYQNLSLDERKMFLENLEAARMDKAVATANALAEGWRELPATVEGLKAVKASLDANLLELRAIKSVEANEVLAQRYQEESEGRALALWPQWVQSSSVALRTVRGAGLSQFPGLRDGRRDRAYLMTIRPPASKDPFFASYQAVENEFHETVDGMVERSESEIGEWIEGMPASDTARIVLDEFIQAVFEAEQVPAKYPGLEEKIRAKRRSYNPDGYTRPDIVLALMRQHWREVHLVGLDDLAHFWTSMRVIRSQCPGVMPQGGPLVGFSMSFARDAVDRAMRGNASRSEASRLFFWLANSVVNQPGCTINEYGFVTGCSTQADLEAGQEAIMTSSAANDDMRKVLSQGCGADGAAGYVDNLETYAGSRYHLPPNPSIPDFWTFVGA